MRVVAPDGTIYGENGKVLHFSIRRFVKDVAQGDCCFVCGRSPKDIPFNNEHVIPQWVLRRFELHDRKITLPNQALRSYSGHTIPCCHECNTDLGKKVEEPVSEMLSAGMQGVRDAWDERKTKLVFSWMALLFVKMQLKDRSFRWSLDPRLGTETIAELHDWVDFHHAHCVAKSAVVGTPIENDAIGTIFIHPAAKLGEERFDFGDFANAKAVMTQIGDLVIFTVLNDAGITGHFMRPQVKRMGRLSPWQAREVLVHLAYANYRIVRRPIFRTDLDSSGLLTIRSEALDEYSLQPLDRRIFGEMMIFANKAFLGSMSEQQREDLLSGQLSFLFRADGSFVDTAAGATTA